MDKPLPAYAGEESFVFVCYSHADNGLVYPEIQRLQDQGFRIWYDDGIAPGSEWSEAIAEAIESCGVFLYFITPNAVASEDCRREVNFALEQKCSMLAVHLLETDVPSALKLSLSHRQAILKYDQSDQRYASRLENVLRDAAAGKHEDADGPPRALRLGDFVLDIASQRLQRDGAEAQLLDPKDMSVLLHLAEAAPGLASTEELLNRSWPGLVVGDNVVHQVIGHLRKALGDNARDPTYLETLPRRGYRLLVKVAPVEDEPRARSTPEVAKTPTVTTQAPANSKIRRLIAAGVAAAAVLLITLVFRDVLFTSVNPRSIAVLPLVDMSPDGDLNWLSQSLTVELHTQLSQPDITLSSQAASSAFRNSNLDIQDIGTQLRVANLIVGTVRKSGSRIRVTLEMVSVEDTYQIWSDVYEGLLDANFNAEIDIATAAASAIKHTFESTSPSLQLSVTDSASVEGAKPSLQELFNDEAKPSSGPNFPSLEDVDVQTFDEFGDVK